MKEKCVLILGASSDIGRALATEYARKGYDLILTTRSIESLEGLKSDLNLRFSCSVQIIELDVMQPFNLIEFSNLIRRLPLGIISCIGELSDESLCGADAEKLHSNIRINAEGPMVFIEYFANKFAKRGFGFVVGISSVAADRGRATNGFYGSAKAMLSTYLSALRNRMFANNVFVTEVRPGFVRTRMTANIKLPEFLVVSPSLVASHIYRAQNSRKEILYTPWFWYWIMLIIRNIPESIFKRMKI